MNEICLELSKRLMFSEELFSTYIITMMINGVSSLLAVIGNILIVASIWKKPSLHTPSYLLLACLAISDLGAGALVQPLYIAFKVAEINSSESFCSLGTSYNLLSILMAFVSFLTVSAISVDRFLAVSLRIRYRAIVTIHRVILSEMVIFAVAGLMLSLFTIRIKVYFIMAVILMSACVILTSLNYGRAIKLLRHHEFQVQSQATSNRPRTPSFTIDRYRKSVNSMLQVYCMFLLCYLPYMCYSIAQVIVVPSAVIHGAYHVTVTIVMLNSAINPCLYYWRFQELRQAIRHLLHLGEPSIVMLQHQQSHHVIKLPHQAWMPEGCTLGQK